MYFLTDKVEVLSRDIEQVGLNPNVKYEVVNIGVKLISSGDTSQFTNDWIEGMIYKKIKVIDKPEFEKKRN